MIHQIRLLPNRHCCQYWACTIGLLLATTVVGWSQPTLRVGANTRLQGSGAVRLIYGGGTLTNNGSLSLTAGSQLIAGGPTTYAGTGTAATAIVVFNHAAGTSTLNSQLSVTELATVTANTRFNTNGQLYLRTDQSPGASLVNNGILTGTVLGLVTKATATTSTTPFTTTLSTNVSGSSMRYQWQSSTDGSQWATVMGATSATYAVYVDGRVFYRCLLTTTNSNYSQFTPALEVKATQPLGINGLTVLHRDVDNYADNNAIQPLLQLQNQTGRSLALSALTLRYYLTVEGAAALSNLSINYAQVGNQNVRLRYVPLSPVQTGASGYVEVSFTEGAGTLVAGASSGSIQAYFAKGDYSGLNELDDYSYNPVRNQLTGNVRITAYYNGVLVAGQEPGAPFSPIRAVRALTESKNGPSATQINTYLEVRNEGNVPINYSDLKARYYFTSDGNERLQVEVDEGNVNARLVKLPQAVNGADTYLELTFNQSGQLAPGASTGTIRYRISKPDGGRFNQANDYSYQEQPQDRSQNNRVVVLATNQVVWGTPPSGAPARLSFAEAGSDLSVKVLGNPIQNDQVSVEVTGAEGQSLQLQLLTLQGRIVSQQQVPSAEATQRHEFSVAGQTGSLFLLQVNTPTQSQTVKVVKAN